jgi:YrbI family 3-deoxy-D-manno-octulosonate 8-phosphate phosphatase
MSRSQIKIVMSDVDGVLTDGGMFYSKTGEAMKKFHTRDGMAIELLRNNNIKTIFISKENSQIVKQRAKKIKPDLTFFGILHKEKILEKICRKFNITNNEIAYIGDDINDLKIMELVGFSATPNDGIEDVKKIAHYVCKRKGGEGVLREVADLILSSKKLINKNEKI